DRLVDLDRDDVDVAIRYGRGDWPGLRIDRLIGEHMFPVCAPRLVDGPPPLRQPADLLGRELLQDHEWRADYWQLWFATAGLPDARPRAGLSFNYSNLMIQAAIDGLGVALVPAALASDDLAAGRLVRPFDICLPTEFGYYLVVPFNRAHRPKITAFREWVMSEIAASGEEVVSATVDGLISG